MMSLKTAFTDLTALTGLRYRTYAGNELATITTTSPRVTEVTQNHKRL